VALEKLHGAFVATRAYRLVCDASALRVTDDEVGPSAPPVDLAAVQLAHMAAQHVGSGGRSSSALTVLRLPHRQHRTGGQTDHPLCDAAEQEVVEPGSAMRAHDDQVRAGSP
jgi:hypothetical protein